MIEYRYNRSLSAWIRKCPVIAPMALEELETMNVTSINQEDVIEAWEADRYGHLKKLA